MIVCPNCNHSNPEGATQCEACYTPLPTMKPCPNCGSSVQTDATFCGQCGYNLQPDAFIPTEDVSEDNDLETIMTPIEEEDDLGETDALEPEESVFESSQSSSMPSASATTSESIAEPISSQSPSIHSSSPTVQKSAATQLQVQVASLLHVQTQMHIELPSSVPVIHLGKPNEQVPPDVDVSGFPHSEVVSRIHADIRVEASSYYIEDMGSSNGTYINHTPLPPGNRHRLRAGDRIALGKGDLVTFIFQLS